MFKYPYSVISSQGLGVAYSSLETIGELTPVKGMGQGDVRVFVNVANGNVVVRDHVCQLIDKNGPLEFCYFYNLQSDVKWRLAASGQNYFKSLPDGSQAILVEADGHETTFYYSSDLDCYVAPPTSNGTSRLSLVNNQ